MFSLLPQCPLDICHLQVQRSAPAAPEHVPPFSTLGDRTPQESFEYVANEQKIKAYFT